MLLISVSEILCYVVKMPLSNDEARREIQDLLDTDERDPSWVARRIGKSYLWVWRRLAGKTPMQMDDYRLICSAFEQPGTRYANRAPGAATPGAR